MKPFKQTIILSFILVIFLSSCKKSQLTTYNTADNVYFNYYRDVNPAQFELGFPADSVNYTFAYSSPDIQSAILPIPVAVTGVPENFDREIKLTVDPSSTATAQHFTLPASFIMHAGRVIDTVFVTLHRTADLQNKGVSAVLLMNASKDFSTDLKSKVRPLEAGAEPDTVQLLTFKILMSDIFAPGPSWGNPYFGTFSLKKVRLLNEVTAMPLNFWSIANGITDYKQQSSLASYYAVFMSRYLQEQASAGHPIFEDDGVTLMRMGSAYQ